MKMSSAYRFIFMQIKLICIRKILHEDSFWNRGTPLKEVTRRIGERKPLLIPPLGQVFSQGKSIYEVSNILEINGVSFYRWP